MTLIIVLIIAFAIATATALVRGLLAFYEDGEALKSPEREDGLRRGIQQNRMMAQRVLFQGLAILSVVLLGVVASRS
jgi:Hypoxia induced protein conserved region